MQRHVPSRACKPATFEYRGWFINDEELHDGMHRDPLGGNVISMEWMDKTLETLLHGKGNMIAPESAPYPDATVYDLCKRREVAITFHHILPVGLNMMSWPKGVPFSFINHKDILIDVWTKSVKVLSDKEVAWTIEFRGGKRRGFLAQRPGCPGERRGAGCGDRRGDAGADGHHPCGGSRCDDHLAFPVRIPSLIVKEN